MKISGIFITFGGAECAAYPVGDPGGSVELAERLTAFCKAVMANPDVACCLAGLHQHHAGDCARQ